MMLPTLQEEEIIPLLNFCLKNGYFAFKDKFLNAEIKSVHIRGAYLRLVLSIPSEKEGEPNQEKMILLLRDRKGFENRTLLFDSYSFPEDLPNFLITEDKELGTMIYSLGLSCVLSLKNEFSVVSYKEDNGFLVLTHKSKKMEVVQLSPYCSTGKFSGGYNISSDRKTVEYWNAPETKVMKVKEA